MALRLEGEDMNVRLALTRWSEVALCYAATWRSRQCLHLAWLSPCSECHNVFCPLPKRVCTPSHPRLQSSRPCTKYGCMPLTAPTHLFLGYFQIVCPFSCLVNRDHFFLVTPEKKLVKWFIMGEEISVNKLTIHGHVIGFRNADDEPQICTQCTKCDKFGIWPWKNKQDIVHLPSVIFSFSTWNFIERSYIVSNWLGLVFRWQHFEGQSAEILVGKFQKGIYCIPVSKNCK